MRVPQSLTPEEARRAFEAIGEIVLGKSITGQAVGTAQTKIAHGLGHVPKGWIEYSPVDGAALPKQSAAPDEKYLYLIASSAVTPSIWVW